MIPLMEVYDRNIYQNDMTKLPDLFPDLHAIFMADHFSIKETDGNFKQLDLYCISTNEVAPEDIKQGLNTAY